LCPILGFVPNINLDFRFNAVIMSGNAHYHIQTFKNTQGINERPLPIEKLLL
jgi:hypothetical protein